MKVGLTKRATKIFARISGDILIGVFTKYPKSNAESDYSFNSTLAAA